MLVGVFPGKADLEVLQCGMPGAPGDPWPLMPQTPARVIDLNALDRTAAGLFKERHILSCIDELGAGDVVGLSLVSACGERRGGRGGTVSPRDESMGASADVRYPASVVNVSGRYLHPQVCIERVAQDRPGDARSAEVLLAAHL